MSAGQAVPDVCSATAARGRKPAPPSGRATSTTESVTESTGRRVPYELEHTLVERRRLVEPGAAAAHHGQLVRDAAAAWR